MSKEPRPSGRGFLNQEDSCSSATLRAAIPPRSSERGILADLREASPESNTHVFTLTMDWLAFTLPDVSAQEVMRQIGGEWTKGKAGFRGYVHSRS